MNHEPKVLWQDEDLVLIAKPPGWTVNNAETASGPVLQHWIVAQEWWDTKLIRDEARWASMLPPDFESTYGTPSQIFEERQGMVHRLDKDTSGVLVWAKHPGSLMHLMRQFRERQVHKSYTCLVHGKFVVLQDVIRLPIERDSRQRQRWRAGATGRPAETEYQVLEYWPHLSEAKVLPLVAGQGGNPRRKLKLYQGFSLLECRPRTGRTHQIRVHLKAIAHPLVCDTTYLGHKRASLDPLWCPRQFLHAAQLQITHPRTGQALSVSAPLWPDLEQVLALFY